MFERLEEFNKKSENAKWYENCYVGWKMEGGIE